jgi:TPR repeat protein
VLLEAELGKVRGESIPDEELTNQGLLGNDRSEAVPGRETSPQFVFHSLGGDSSQTRRFASRYLPWLAASAAALILGFVAPRFVSRIQGSATSLQKKILGQAEMAVPRQQSEQPASSPAEPVSGTEVPDERKTSTEKLLADAKAGDPIAQFFLGVHYLNGSGVEQDRAAAAAWYIIAGVNGNLASKQAAVEVTRKLTPAEIADTRLRVGKMFLDGVGTSRDVISAYSWFALAKAAGNPLAIKELQGISKDMTPEQLSEARLRAIRWLTTHGIKPKISENLIANTTPAQ